MKRWWGLQLLRLVKRNVLAFYDQLAALPHQEHFNEFHHRVSPKSADANDDSWSGGSWSAASFSRGDEDAVKSVVFKWLVKRWICCSIFTCVSVFVQLACSGTMPSPSSTSSISCSSRCSQSPRAPQCKVRPPPWRPLIPHSSDGLGCVYRPDNLERFSKASLCERRYCSPR